MNKKWFAALGVTVLTLGIGTAAFADGIQPFSGRGMQETPSSMMEDYPNMNADEMLRFMEERQMDAADMRAYMRDNQLDADEMRDYMKQIHPDTSDEDIDRMYNHCHGDSDSGRGMMGYRSSMMR